MAADTPVRLGKNGVGGARPNSGRPKGSTNGIRIDTLRLALQNKLGQPFEDVIGLTAVKLFQDFQEDRNVESWVRFSNNVMRYVVQSPQQEIKIDAVDQLYNQEEVQARIKELMEKNANAG